MIAELRRLAIELRQEAEELTEGQDPEVNWDAQDELNDELAQARMEIAARIELVLKRGMLDTAERMVDTLTLKRVGLAAQASDDLLTLAARGGAVTLELPEDLDEARKLRDFLVAALLPHEHDTGL